MAVQRSYEIMQVAEIAEVPSSIGIADSEIFLQGTMEQINARLDLMQSLGVTNVRILVPWAAVQPLHPDTPFGLGAARWEQLDRVVNAAAARDMGILGVINSTPVWATSSTPLNGQPANFNEYANFAKSVALRYGDKISAYEVWNEPNSVQFWNPLDPVAYTEMLRVTYTALKEASAQTGSEITVIGGVVGAGMTWGDLTMNPVDFVREMYEAGADGYFDAFSFHPYNYDWKFSVGDSLPWREGMPLYQLDRIRELMDSYQDVGEEQVKIWITEYGVPTNKVSEATQAAFIRDLIEYWQTAEGAGPVFIYTIQDRLDLAGTDDEAHLGIFRPDGSIKPAAEVLRELIEYYSDPANPGPVPSPVTPTNPIAALLLSLQQAVTSLFNLLPNMFNAFSVLITNLVRGIFGGAAQTPATAMAARTAALADEVDVAEPAATEGVQTEAAVDATATGQKTAPNSVTEGAAAVPVVQEAAEGLTEPASEESPVVDTTETPEPTTETDAVESNDNVTDIADDSDTKVAEDDAATSPQKDDATIESGKPDVAEAFASDDAESVTRETEAADPKAGVEQKPDQSGDDDAAAASGNESASSSRTSAGTTAGAEG
ncbi:cellulase family glycosylhydrolase [Mycolicibacterium frederiksbergense]|uniref:cellulase family glycosylhydrolase n=1 Tax=Mycolicibacterium frederiksbergense TaxID=117567 RepID=UPI00265B8B76|nr:cellulase family glycosylhydrolase [Mycolicibacterium frederiksbergense]MDO0972837.1 cellulase family glycosylhydrolase [Mycolicibacterium frederiksbergense]